ncbi:response regulator [Streptomyces griseus]|uniref:response regulator n=1 Tax=Streptomyces griseus TaxID=1911 RepID=UPI0038029FBB
MLKSADGFTVLGEASGGKEAVELTLRTDPDVVLVDLRMPTGSGVEAIAELTHRGVRARVPVLTTYDTDSDTLPAIEAGATGYLLKDALRDELYGAIRAAAGRTVLSPAIATRLVTAVRNPAAPPADDPLSTRELQILEHVERGASNREIARALFISEATVKKHLTHIYDKLDVLDVLDVLDGAAAVAAGFRRGILG